MAILDWRKPLCLRLQAQSAGAQPDHGTPDRTTVGWSVSTHSLRVWVARTACSPTPEPAETTQPM
jgi:hypothetical protein